MQKKLVLLLVAALSLLSVLPLAAQESVITLDFMCYQDGNECEVYDDLLTRFEADNPGIDVVVSEGTAYQDILEVLPIRVETGDAPDIARITSFPNFADAYLDMRPYMEDPDAFEANFADAVLASFRDADDGGLHGFPDGLTVTGPFINATLFEQAGVDIPEAGTSWEEWVEVLTEVRDATGVDYGFAIDNRGHRFAGPAISQGATLFDDEGNFDLAGDEGFQSFASILKGMLDSGLSPIETWSTGDSYVAADEYFRNANTVMYFSGSWQIGNFAENIGDAFDWQVVASPAGPGGSTGVSGGAALAAFDSGDDARNAAIATVMEYLASPEVYAEFSGRTLIIPANSGAVAEGVEFQSDNPAVVDALNAFSEASLGLTSDAISLNIHPFAFAYYGASNTRLQQYFAGELTVEEMTEALQADIDDAVANAEA